jgi:tetratricopeptide (TPR) repeat protein
MQRTGKSLVVRLIALALAGMGALGAHGLGAGARAERETWPKGEGLVWLPPPRAAPIVAMGYRQLWADINWARSLVYYGLERRESETFQYRYLTRFLDNIIALDPKFKRVYDWAAYGLLYQGGTARPEEYLQTIPYLERAIQEFPDGYRFFWIAGTRYYIYLETDDPAQKRRYHERAAVLLEQAMRKRDAPPDLPTYAAGLRTQLGQHERALHDLREVIMTTDDPKAQERLIAAYREMAGKEFPEEATRAKVELQRGWMEHLPFASPHLYIVLGDRPPRAIDLYALAAEQSVFSALLDEPAPDQESDEATGEEPRDAAGAGQSAPDGTGAAAEAPAQRGAQATPVP